MGYPTSRRTGGQSSSATAEIPDDRYAAQVSLEAERSATQNSQAPMPTMPSDMRFAQLPEPLDLPAEGTEIDDVPLSTPATTPRSTASNRFAGTNSISPSAKPAVSEATRLMQEGENALQRQDSKTAAALFGQAYVLREELDRDKQIQLQGYLQKLAAISAPAALPTPPMAGRMSGSTLIDSAAADQQAQARQMSAEVGKKQSEARRLRDTKPQEAVKLLQQTREQVAASQLSEEYRTQLTRRIDITLDETEKYIKDHAQK